MIVGTGTIDMPENLSVMCCAVTDSGRIFVQGMWSGTGHQHDSALASRYPIFEIDRASNALQQNGTEQAFPSNAVGKLLGSEGEDPVLQVAGPDVPMHLKWVATR